MRKRNKSIAGIFLCIGILLCMMTACGTAEPSGNAEKNKTVEIETKQEKTAEDEAVLDVDSVEEDQTDYSKYEEKGTSQQKKQKESKQAENSSDPSTDSGQNGVESDPGTTPAPVNPDDVQVDTSEEGTCYLQISCASILNRMSDLTPGKEKLVPADGLILEETAVTFYPGESVFDVLQRETRNNRIHLEASFTPKYNSAYIEGIHNLYEFDCGSLSGWMYAVNGWYPNYGCSQYQVQEGDVIHWDYTCDLGRDLGTVWEK